MANEKLVRASEAKSKLMDIHAWFDGPEQTAQDRLAQAVSKMCAEEIEKLEPVDAVEVVRCKECQFSKFFEESGTRKCRAQNGMYRTVEDGDFCSYGERRSDNA